MLKFAGQSTKNDKMPKTEKKLIGSKLPIIPTRYFLLQKLCLERKSSGAGVTEGDEFDFLSMICNELFDM